MLFSVNLMLRLFNFYGSEACMYCVLQVAKFVLQTGNLLACVCMKDGFMHLEGAHVVTFAAEGALICLLQS